ncbi:MAG: hypothetical protein HY033_08850 [Ignavibacteriae bacterium]|nr:hypothetical protein [Ignavibacteria bacterium]MBI3364999.1 hypothetical protein [Ignavibacteriota bacterium]
MRAQSPGAPHKISYQGALTYVDSHGKTKPVKKGRYKLTFDFYDDAAAGNLLYSESDSVTADKNGVYVVTIGDNGTPYGNLGGNFTMLNWLKVTILGGPETHIGLPIPFPLPRVQLTSVPYALNSRSLVGPASFAKDNSAVAGGVGNEANASYATVGGGFDNAASSGGATVGGGQFNTASGNFATVPGGSSNSATGGYSFAAGQQAKAMHNGTFVWADSENADFASTGENQFLIRAKDGVGIGYNLSPNFGSLLAVFDPDSAFDIGIGVRNDKTNASAVIGGADYGPVSKAIYGFSNQGYAGYFQGKVKVLGDFSVTGVKSFVIDHPLDPANKYLYHSCVESPDMKNIYDGVATLDGGGEAIVQLPEWFEALNKDFRYQLTALGAPGPNLYIAQEVSGNSFKIAGGVAGSRVSWQVTGIRQDAYANAHPMQVEVAKEAEARGKYLSPKEHGMPESMGIDWEKTSKVRSQHKVNH